MQRIEFSYYWEKTSVLLQSEGIKSYNLITIQLEVFITEVLLKLTVMMAGARPCKQILMLNINHMWYSPLFRVSQWQEYKIKFRVMVTGKEEYVLRSFGHLNIFQCWFWLIDLIVWHQFESQEQKNSVKDTFSATSALNMADGLYLIWCKTRQQKGKENRERYVVAFVNSSNFKLLLVLQNVIME